LADLSVIELCAGAGGQSLGLHLAGFQHTLAVEIDAMAALTLQKNLGRLASQDGHGVPSVAIGDVADESANALSLREREVLALLAEGASNKEIARALALSIHTVKFHVAALTEKLGARSRGEAVAIAIRAGLVMV